MKKGKLVIILVLILFLCGCENGKIHEYEEFIDYVDYMDCEYSVLCGLKGKYEVISDEKRIDNRNKETRTLTFKVNNTDLTFKVTSEYMCTGSIDASCFEYTYQLVDDYQEEARKYYFDKINKLLNYNNELCTTNYSYKSNCNGKFEINTSSDLEFAIRYMNQFLDITNNLDVKYLKSNQDIFNLTFNKETSKELIINIVLKDEKYVYDFDDNYKPIDNKLETYINNYLSQNQIMIINPKINE